MRYFVTASTERVREAMRAGLIGQIVTPAEGKMPLDGVEWIADNSVFADKYPGDELYLAWLVRLPHPHRCRFAVAPDVVCDAQATLARSLPMLARIRAVVPVAYVAQNGAAEHTLPWDSFDALFIGGDTEWKLGTQARRLIRAARRLGKWVHMGRVNSQGRLQRAADSGCDSADGTYLAFGPDSPNGGPQTRARPPARCAYPGPRSFAANNSTSSGWRDGSRTGPGLPRRDDGVCEPGASSPWPAAHLHPGRRDRGITPCRRLASRRGAPSTGWVGYANPTPTRQRRRRHRSAPVGDHNLEPWGVSHDRRSRRRRSNRPGTEPACLDLEVA